MSQERAVQVMHGVLTLGDEILKAAHLRNTARVIVKERAIIILPNEEDVVEDSFGWIQVPRAAAKEIVQGKDLEYDL